MNHSTFLRSATRLACAIVVMTVLVLGGTQKDASAQSVGGRIAFGFDAGANKYWGNFSDNQFGFSGDLFIRWNILDWLSLSGAYNGGVLRYATGTKNISAYPDYFGKTAGTGTYNGVAGGIVVEDGNSVRVGGWEFMLSTNFFPSQTFVPYLTAGVEILNFAPKTNSGLFIPSNTNPGYNPQVDISKQENVLGGVLGTGFEMYITPKVTFNAKLLLHLTGTDWLDGYSDPATAKQDVFMTFGLGFSYYIFAPDAPVTENRIIEHDIHTYTNNTNTITEHTIFKKDTIFVATPADTVYLAPAVNTIFNFPGTLFIVNTDQFNTDIPDNMTNLHRIRYLAEQCPNMQIEIDGYASAEGTPARNQELSEMRARRIKTWLLEQGVSPDHISGTVGYGTSNPMVPEPAGVTGARLEEIRVQNRRIAARVTRTCN